MTTLATNSVTEKSTLLVLEAFEHVHNDQTQAYELMGKSIDELVKNTEPGMLVHALTKVSENEDETLYRWLEVFDGEKALETHINNPHVISHIEAMNKGVLSGTTDIVIYADWSEAVQAQWRETFAGANLTFAAMITGFFVAR